MFIKEVNRLSHEMRVIESSVVNKNALSNDGPVRGPIENQGNAEKTRGMVIRRPVGSSEKNVVLLWETLQLTVTAQSSHRHATVGDDAAASGSEE